MSVASRFYNRENSFTSGDMNDVLTYLEDYDDDDDPDAKDKYLEDVPYSSSSVDVDRSSIGSIPWADDAIKQNQLDWERIECMLRGGEEGATALPVNEPELLNEIAEWQRKFPQLLMSNDGTKQKQQSKQPQQQHQQQQEKKEADAASDALADNSRTKTGRVSHNKTLDIRSISNLSLDSLEDDDLGVVEDDEELNGKPLNSRLTLNFDESEEFGDIPLAAMTTPTNQRQQQPQQFHRLASLLSTNLRIRSVPLTLRQRGQQVPSTTFANGNGNHDDDEDDDVGEDDDEDNFSTASTPVPPTPPPRHPPKNLLTVASNAHILPPPLNHGSSQAQRRTRMPPILNVLESTRRFRGLTNSHRSFVQLTQITDEQQQQQQQQQQAKSAAIRTHNARKLNTHSAWHAPFAASKVSSNFMNHRNAIILPSINRQTAQHLLTTTTTETTSENGRGGVGGRNASRNFFNSTSSPSSRTHNFLLPQHQQQPRHQQQHQQRNNLNGLGAAAATSTSTTGTPSSNTGRSISAVVHHQHYSHPRRMEFNAFYLPYSAASKFKAFK